MTTEQLNKFIKEKNIEVDWRGENKEHLYAWFYFFQLDDFDEIMSPSFFDDGGFNVTMMEGSICLDLVPICEYEGIKPTDILTK